MNNILLYWVPIHSFFILILSAGVQLGPLGTSSAIWPTVPAPGDYEDVEFGRMTIGRGN
jgi:hypothetical protein